MDDSMESLVVALQDAVAGLTYPSESDEPFETVHWPASMPLDASGILTYGGHPDTASVEPVDYDEFFAGLTSDEDWWGDEEYKVAHRFETLKDILDANLADRKVFRIASLPEHESQVLIYVVGLHASGHVVGLKTLSTET